MHVCIKKFSLKAISLNENINVMKNVITSFTDKFNNMSAKASQDMF